MHHFHLLQNFDLASLKFEKFFQTSKEPSIRILVEVVLQNHNMFHADLGVSLLGEEVHSQDWILARKYGKTIKQDFR